MRPGTMTLLHLLSQADSTGMTAGDLTRQFSEPAALGTRNRLVNSTLQQMRTSGYVDRATAAERSRHYHGAPVYRWFITPGGQSYLQGGGPPGRRLGATAKLAARQLAKQERAARYLTEFRAAAKLAALAGSCLKKRNATIGKLRQESHLTLEDIGGLFGLTRERVRQITDGHSGRRCPCAECRGQSAPDPKTEAN